MRYTLIDTSIWINIVFDEDGQSYVHHLTKLIENNEIIIVTTKEIYTEWENQINKSIVAITNNQKKQLKDLSKTIPDVNLIIDKIDEKTRYLIEKITFILNNNCIEAPYYSIVGTEVMERYRSEKAPFHKKRDSNNDALIYFTAINYIKKEGLNNLTFITGNTNDFSDPSDKTLLHYDLQIDGLNIDYCISLKQFFKRFFPLKENKEDDTEYSNISICYEETLKNKHPLDQLYYNLKHYFSQVDFIPLNILSLLFPLKIQGKGYSEYTKSKIVINNNNLATILPQLNRGKIEGVTKSKEKIEQIKTWLNQNAVGSIEHYQDSNLSFKFSSHEQCDCIVCLYQRFEYKALLKKLPEKPTNIIRDNLTHAFIYFELGNYYFAFQFLKKAYEISIHNKLEHVKYICAINIKTISKHLYNKDASKAHEINEFTKKIDLNKEYINLYRKDTFSKFFAEKYHENQIYYQHFSDIEDIVGKIRDDYAVHLNGYTRNNNYVRELMQLFINYQNLLWKTPILFSHYSNNNALFARVLEGYIISYHIGKDDTQTTILLGFNNNMLEQIMHFCSPDTLQKILNRYRTSSIVYVQNEYSHYIFHEQIINLLKDYDSVKSKINFDGTGIWDNKIFDQIFKGIILCSVLEYTIESVNEVFAHLIIFLNENHLGKSYLHRHLQSFIYRKGDILYKKNLIKFIECFNKNEYLANDTDVIISFCRVVAQNHADLLDTEDEINTILLEKFLYKKDDENNNNLLYVIPYLYTILNLKSKSIIHDYIDDLLTNKFDSELYCTATLYNIISYKKHFDQYISTVPIKLDDNFFTVRDTNRKLEDLINITFKNNIRLESNYIQKFKGQSDYYDWLLDMDNFDYTKFIPTWILRNQIKYYLKRIYNHPKVNNTLIEYFNNSKSPNKLLLEFYFKYRE